VRILDIAVPPRLGRSFRWLLATSVVNNIGDGVALAAGPLLVASQTRDPFLVSLAVFSAWLPNLLLSVPAGAIADRFDRRTIMAAVNLLRAVVLAALALTIVIGAVNIALVLLALLTLGFAETFADVAGSSLLPRVVPDKQDLGIANARLQGSVLVTNQMIAPPIGAFLFALGMSIPFGVNAACFALGAVLIFRVGLTVPADEAPTERRHLLAEMVDGVRWLVAHPPMRTLALTILAFNVTFGAAWSVLVLYAQDRLGMTDVGFGLLTTALAVGGIIGIGIYGALERRFSLANIMRVGLSVETLTHLALALTTSPIVALGVMVVFGTHAFVWGTTSTTVRQRAVPDALLGRVTGVYGVAIYLGLVLGAPIGGALATAYGVTAPFWFGFIGSFILVVLLWGQFDKIVHAGDNVPHGVGASVAEA
jgi:MFS family permease